MKNYSVIASKNYQHPILNQIYLIQRYFPDCECIDIYVSKSKGDNIKNAAVASLKSDFLVVIGGDGTLNEVVNGIIKSNPKIPLLFIPAGTVNDMGRNVDYHDSLKEYIMEARENQQTHDIFCYNSEIFCAMASGGFLMNVPYTVSLGQKLQKKKKAYLEEAFLEGFSETPIRHMNISIDDKKIEGDYIAAIFSNTHSLYGMPIYENVSLNDNVCELMLIKNYSKMKSLLELYKVIKEKKKIEDLSFAEYYQGQDIKIEMNQLFPNYFCLDGEQSIINKKMIEVKPLAKVLLMKGTQTKETI